MKTTYKTYTELIKAEQELNKKGYWRNDMRADFVPENFKGYFASDDAWLTITILN